MSERHARRTVYTRSDGACEVCGNRPGQSVHHRKNRSQGGIWEPANNVHLCGDGVLGCHGFITMHPTTSYQNGWLVRHEFTPAEVPVLYRGRWVLLDDDGNATEVEGPHDEHW